MQLRGIEGDFGRVSISQIFEVFVNHPHQPGYARLSGIAHGISPPDPNPAPPSSPSSFCNSPWWISLKKLQINSPS